MILYDVNKISKTLFSRYIKPFQIDINLYQIETYITSDNDLHIRLTAPQALNDTCEYYDAFFDHDGTFWVYQKDRDDHSRPVYHHKQKGKRYERSYNTVQAV